MQDKVRKEIEIAMTPFYPQIPMYKITLHARGQDRQGMGQ